MKVLVFFLGVLMLLGCKEEEGVLQTDPGYAFFPLEPGQYRTYQVEEIVFTALSTDTSRYFLKEKIEDSLMSDDGHVKYLLYRYKSADTIDWTLDSIWTVQRLNDVILQYENGTPLVKMAFPVTFGTTWNGNAFNSHPEVTYYYEEVDELRAGDDPLPEEELIRVIIEDIPQNLVNQDERSEVYSKNIGLIEKNYVTLNFCSVNCSDLGEIQSGRILDQELIDYGNE